MRAPHIRSVNSPPKYAVVKHYGSDNDISSDVKTFRSIQVRYRKDPHMQNSMRKLKLTLTLVLTLTDTGGAVLTLMLGYKSLYITIWQ